MLSLLHIMAVIFECFRVTFECTAVQKVRAAVADIILQDRVDTCITAGNAFVASALDKNWGKSCLILN